MTEINKNISNFIPRIETDIKTETGKTEKQKPTEENDDRAKYYIHDTGVLGRSQVKNLRGSNIEKSVDEAVTLAENNPALLGCCENVFNSLYKDFTDMGMEPSEAYMKALFGEQELLDISKDN